MLENLVECHIRRGLLPEVAPLHFGSKEQAGLAIDIKAFSERYVSRRYLSPVSWKSILSLED